MTDIHKIYKNNTKLEKMLWKICDMPRSNNNDEHLACCLVEKTVRERGEMLFNNFIIVFKLLSTFVMVKYLTVGTGSMVIIPFNMTITIVLVLISI